MKIYVTCHGQTKLNVQSVINGTIDDELTFEGMKQAEIAAKSLPKTHLHDEALPADFENFMDPEHVVSKTIANLKLDQPELDLIIKRPN